MEDQSNLIFSEKNLGLSGDVKDSIFGGIGEVFTVDIKMGTIAFKQLALFITCCQFEYYLYRIKKFGFQ